MTILRKVRFLLLGVLAVCVGAGVLFDSARAQTTRPLEKITFLLDFTPYGKHAPFFAALDKGFWKDAGFDVTMIKGEGSATTIASYGAGTVDFAFADTPALILARSSVVSPVIFSPLKITSPPVTT